MRAVNLLPGESKGAARGTPQPAVLAGAIAGFVAVVVIGGGNLVQAERVSSAQKALNAAKIQLAATPLPPNTPSVTPPPAAVAQQMQPRLDAVSSVISTRIAWDRILREFSLVLPPGIQVQSLSLAEPAGATTTQTATGFQLTGVTYTYDDVARLLSRMALIPDLSGVSLKSSGITQNVVSFEIDADVKGAPVPASPVVPPAAPTTTTTGATS
jgi:Fimbrial assembly protein (PilN)